MIWNTLKDYTNAFIGIVVLIVPLLFVPEVKKLKSYVIISICAFFILLLLGIDKINRDNDDKTRNETKRLSDSARISNLTQSINHLGRDDAKFKEELRSKFKIIDSANVPVSYNTHIDNARDVYIGTKH